MIRNPFGTNIRILRSEFGGEYLSREFQSYLQDCGILFQTSCPRTPQINGVAERKNRHLLEVTRALLFQMKVPKSLWSESVNTACYLINRMPSRVLGKNSPFQTLLPGSPVYSIPLRVFGCVCFVHVLFPSLDKLSHRFVKCIFVGYSSSQKG